MDIRVLRYFIATVRAQSISAAAAALGITQPTLSRQLIELEEELGHRLFERSNRKIHLTPKGELFLERAEEVVELFERAKTEISADDDPVGTLSIAAAETPAMRYLAEVIQDFHRQAPRVKIDISSSNESGAAAALRSGIADIAVFTGTVDLEDYSFIRLPLQDRWGVLTPKDGPLAGKAAASPQDLRGLPLLVSKQAFHRNEFAGWLRAPLEALRIVGYFNLIYNAALLAEQGFGHAVSLEGIYQPGPDSRLCWLPLAPALAADVHVCWPKFRTPSRAAEVFIEKLHAKLAADKSPEAAHAQSA